METIQVQHQVTPRELLELFTVALQYKVDNSDPENAGIILRAHEALDREFKKGLKQGLREGYAAALDSAKQHADNLFSDLGIVARQLRT
jgi:flagellar biosynthesis/type III secretory pathway protein FliH